MEQIKSKDMMLNKLRAQATTPDDDVIVAKDKIKKALLQCPELLYVLNNNKLQSELFNADGSLNANYNDQGELEPLGAWDEYFGYNIRPYLFLDQTQTNYDNFICYTIGFREVPANNKFEYYAQITFTILCSAASEQLIDFETGIPRHDLIGSILRERFAGSNLFGTQCKLISNQEKTHDSNYVSRQLVFESTKPNSQVRTPLGGKTETISHLIRK